MKEQVRELNVMLGKMACKQFTSHDIFEFFAKVISCLEVFIDYSVDQDALDKLRDDMDGMRLDVADLLEQISKTIEESLEEDEESFYPPPWNAIEYIEKTDGWNEFQRCLRRNPEHYKDLLYTRQPEVNKIK